jgi:Trypsin-like peptidase domain
MRTIIAASILLVLETSAYADQAFIYSLRASHCGQAPASRMLTAFRMAGTKGVVTALHGVSDCAEIQATNRSGPALLGTLKVYDVDTAHDAARVSSAELEQLQADGLQPASESDLSGGTPALAIGYPLSTDLEDSAVPVTIPNPPLRILGDMLNTSTRQSLRDVGSPDVSAQVLFVVGFISPGDSGAPIINKDDRVLGIVSGGLGQGSGISWAFPSWSIKWTPLVQAKTLTIPQNHLPIGLYYAAADGLNLELSILKAQHTYFYLYGPPQANPPSVPGRTPDFSMLRSSNGFNVAYFVGDPFLLLHSNPAWDTWLAPNESFFQPQAISQKREGSTYTGYRTMINPRAIVLPEGEVVVDFLVSNTGLSGTMLDGVSVDVVSRVDLPPSIAGEFSPEFKIYKDIAVIGQGRSSYPMLNDQVLNYDPGQKDIYRFSVRIADSENPGLFSCRLRLSYSINGQKFETVSDPFWVAKYFGGRTNRNVYSKFHTDIAPSTTLAYGLRHVDGVDSVDRPPRYFTHSLLAQMFHGGSRDFDIPGIRTDRTMEAMMLGPENLKRVPLLPLPWADGGSYNYALSHLPSALIEKGRTAVQKFGFTINGARANKEILIAFDSDNHSFGGSDHYQSYTNDLNNAGTVKRVLEVYIGSSTKEYTALQLAVGDTVIMRKAGEVDGLSDALIRFSHENIDVAAMVDLIPLLAVVNTQASLDRLVDFLRDENPVVQHEAATALRYYRWPNAAAQLWVLAGSSIPYVRDAATSALEMSGTPREAGLLKQEILDSKTTGEKLARLTRVLTALSPATAEGVLKAPETREEVRAVLTALTAN